MGRLSLRNKLTNSFSVTSSPYGPELVTNGTFDTNTDGWSGADKSSILSVVGGQMDVEIGSGNTVGRGYQSITTVIGLNYEFNADVTNVDSTNGIRLKVSNTDGLNSAYATGTYNDTTSPVAKQILFTATATTTYIGVDLGGSVGQSALVDNVSVREVL